MRQGLALVGALIALTAASPGQPGPADDAAIARGLALFAGAAPLEGTMENFPDPLPSAAIRCANCHAEAADAAGRKPIGGALKAQDLTRPASRRGGPPSSYSDAGLCRLLRTGVDPAGIYVSGSMPRYRIADADCRALLAYLQTRS